MIERSSPHFGPHGRSLIWITSLPPGPNGATLRYLNYSKWLRRAGFFVHFAVPETAFDQDHLARLVEDGWIDGFSKLNVYRAAGPRNAVSRLFLLPGVRNQIMAREQAPFKEELIALLQRYDANVCIISDRNYLFAARTLSQICRTVIDWADSYSLFHWRAILNSIRCRAWREVPNQVHLGIAAFLEERYYPKLSNANIMVSPADLSLMHRICPGAADLRVVFNGSESSDQSSSYHKFKDRLVFSGRMDFPPNYQAALWFIDQVLPRVRKRKPSVHLVIAGTNPTPELKMRQSEFVRVTGHVPDMRKELSEATLYVAPLVSGSGFKNKILESIAAGTPVVGTPFAAEFLPPELRSVVLVAKGSEVFGDTIVRCLDTPNLLADELAEAQRFLRAHFSWQARTADLLHILDPTHI